MKIPQLILYLVVKDLIAPPPQIGNKTRMPAIAMIIQCCTGDARHNNKERKGNKKCKDGKERS